MSSLLLQARNLIVSLLVFRCFDDPAALWGAVNQTSAVVTLLAVFAHLGLDFTAVQLVSRYRDTAPASALTALRLTSVLRVVFTALVAMPMLLWPAFVSEWVGMSDVPELVTAGGVLLVSTSLYEFSAYIVSANDDFVSMAWARLVFTVVNVTLIGFIVWGAFANPALQIVLAQALAGFVATSAVLPSLIRHTRRLSTKAASLPAQGPRGTEILRSAFLLAAPMTLVAASGRIFNYADRVLLPVLASREALGSYAVAVSVISAALFGTYALRNIARTRLPGELDRDKTAARRTLLATYRISNFVAIWIATGAIVVAPDLIVLIYGPEAAAAAAMLPWFAPFVLLTAHASFSATALVSADRAGAYTRITLWMMALNLALNVLLIPMFQGYGSLIAMTMSTLPLAVWSYREVARAYGDELWSRQMLNDAMPALMRHMILALLGLAAGYILSGPRWDAAVLAGITVSLVFVIGAWKSGEYDVLRRAA